MARKRTRTHADDVADMIALRAAREAGNDREATRIRNRFVAAHLGLAWMIARKVYGARRYDAGSLSLEDVAQEGMFGLVRALDTWDEGRGLKFSTYASPWVRAFCERGIDNHGRLVRLPVHVGMALRLARREAQRIERTSGRTATVEEIHAAAPRVAIETLREAAAVAVTPWSLDAPAFPGAPGSLTTIGDTLSDRDAPLPGDRLDDAGRLARLGAAIEALSERDRKVIRDRFFRGRKLHEIGDDLGVCRERARQLEERALAELRDVIEAQEAA